MSHLDESGRPDPPLTGGRRRRARHDEAAPEPSPYAERPEYREPEYREPEYREYAESRPRHADHPEQTQFHEYAEQSRYADHPPVLEYREYPADPDLTGELTPYPSANGADGDGSPQDADPDLDGVPDTGPPRGKRRRAGRNLPAAIGVGAGLGGVVIASLLVWKPAFLAVLVVAVAVGVWEMARAVRPSGAHPPMVPLIAGGVSMMGLAWFGGAAALPLGLMATVVAVLIWRLGDGPAGYQTDVTMATLIAIYVPFLGAFVALLARYEEDGALRVLVTLIAVVLSDTGGYVTGVFLGRRPMAPTVSPKKSWEGFAGSLVWAGAGGAVLLSLMLDVAWWYGVLFGVLVSAASVLGDLAESLLKRDLGIKDMSNLLPGHGGLMDRLDSILLAAPVAYAVLVVVAPT